MLDHIKTKDHIKWLQSLLEIYFSDLITLSIDSNDRFCLNTDGSDYIIQIAPLNDLWKTGSQDLAYSNCMISAGGARYFLPAPGMAEQPPMLIEKTPIGYYFHYDIMGLAFWMMTRAEEVGRKDLDLHGRFPATSSHSFKYGYLERPVVDEWFCLLRYFIRLLWPNLPLKKHQFITRLSHDVDEPSRYGFRSPLALLRDIGGRVVNGDMSCIVKAPWIRMKTRRSLHPGDPLNTFDYIMDISEKHGLTSAFYFLCGRSDPAKDSDYELEHPAIRDLIRHISIRGHEIGLHASYNTYQNPERVIAEANRLKRVCTDEHIAQTHYGGRMHYLRWETPTSLYGWEKAGIKYDTTLGYADIPGFRCGTCYEYPAFDPVKGKMLNLWIRPLIAMDRSVISKRYLGLGVSHKAFIKFKQLKDSCRSVRGCFTLLWHNSQLDSPEKQSLYVSLINESSI